MNMTVAIANTIPSNKDYESCEDNDSPILFLSRDCQGVKWSESVETFFLCFYLQYRRKKKEKNTRAFVVVVKWMLDRAFTYISIGQSLLQEEKKKEMYVNKR